MKNEEIQTEVENALKWQPMLEEAGIGVTVKDGVVTLSGIVDVYAKKELAEKTAKKVKGVKAIVEHITVHLASPGSLNDQEIAQAILDTFKWHWDIPDSKIRVKVENGLVTLEGEVNWNYEKEAARKTVSRLIGVRAIKNDITVKAHRNEKIDIREVQDALWRNPNIDDEDINVTLEGHTIKLQGTVRSWYQKEEAGRMAWSAPGVEHVDNQLLVDNTLNNIG